MNAPLELNAVKYAGKHLIIELWDVDASLLSSTDEIKQILETAVLEAGATILGSNFHHFGEDCGVTGVIMLSESHASIHTWPEFNYAAIDVFMCGKCDPMKSMGFILRDFKTINYRAQEIYRGIMPIK